MLAAYFDESGNSSDSRIVAMGGFIGSAVEWEQFGNRWKILMREHGDGKEIVFHMSELESSRGDFEGWSKERRKALLGDVFSLLEDFFLLAIGGVVVVEHFDTLPDIAQRAFGDPWFLCMQMCLGEIGGFHMYTKESGPDDMVAVFCDRQMEFSGRGTDCFNYISTYCSFGKRLGSITFAPKDVLVQLQAADLVAYEVKKLVENTLYAPHIPKRWPMMKLQERPFTCSYLDLTGSVPTVSGSDLTLFRRSRILIDAGEMKMRSEAPSRETGKYEDE